MPKFKVGDTVIGNEKANGRYNITKEGFIGKVTDAAGGLIRLNCEWTVEDCYFDLYEPEINVPMDDWDTMYS